MKKIICLYVPPGAGKTTQGKLLVEQFGFSLFGMGERLRAEIESGSKLGQDITPYVNGGTLIPDEYMEQIIIEAEKVSNDKGLILDGFPRIVSQAKMLDRVMEKLNLEVSAFILLSLSKEEALNRIQTRAKLEGGRKDDVDEIAVSNRFSTFNRESVPLNKFYRDRGIFKEIKGEMSIEDINEEIVKYLQL